MTERVSRFPVEAPIRSVYGTQESKMAHTPFALW